MIHMNRKLLMLPAVFLLLAASAQGTPILSIPSVYNFPDGLRMMLGSTGLPGSSAMTVKGSTSKSSGSFTLSSTGVDTLDVSPLSGTVSAKYKKSISFSFGWADTSTAGARSGEITLGGNWADPNHDELTVEGAVLENRPLDVESIGADYAPARIMVNSKLIQTITSGGGDDTESTRVDTVKNGKITQSKNGLTVSYANPRNLIATFDAADQTADIAAKFSKTGHYEGSVDLVSSYSSKCGSSSKGLLTDGEDKSVGAKVQPVVLSYNVQVLEQRKLQVKKGTLNFGDVLKGATVSGYYVVDTKNRIADDDHLTRVLVAPGGTALGGGELIVEETEISGAGRNVPILISGTLTEYNSRLRVAGKTPVVTAEDASVGDTHKYQPLTFSYSANVGIAKLGKKKTEFGGTVLKASVLAGSTMESLSSKVDPCGTLVKNWTLAEDIGPVSSSLKSWGKWDKWGRCGWLEEMCFYKNMYGVVGSEAEIVTSTALSSDTVVSMTWRARTPGEAFSPKATTLPDPSMPSDSKWLTSDVVKIGGITSDTTYALQMTFDNRINLALDFPNGSIDEELQSLYIAQYNTTTAKWEKAGTGVGVLESLADFLAAHSNLEDVVGSWGVDPASKTDPHGIGRSWVIVAGGGSGIFAVVPEPSTLVLLAIAGISFSGYRLRQRRKSKSSNSL